MPNRPAARPRTALVMAVAFVLAGVFVPTPAGAIYLGRNVTFSSYRWMVSLRLARTPDQHNCGGTLIAKDMVLTAAHCVHGHGQHDFVAVVGADTSDWSNPHKAPRIPVIAFKEAAFNPSLNSNKNDIAVLRLKSPRSSPTLRLATNEPKVGRKVTTAGWGCTQKPPACGLDPTRLKVADQVMISDILCGPTVFKTPHFYGPSALCTKGTSTVNGGDSGGPLLIGDAQTGFTEVGITSILSDNPAKRYASFTSVAYELSWVTHAMAALRG